MSAAEYKKNLKRFFGEDARKMRETTTTNAWELVLDNMPTEKENIGDGRCVEALRSQKKTRQEDSEEKEEEIEGKKRSRKFAKRVSSLYKQKEGR